MINKKIKQRVTNALHELYKDHKLSDDFKTKTSDVFYTVVLEAIDAECLKLDAAFNEQGLDMAKKDAAIILEYYKLRDELSAVAGDVGTSIHESTPATFKL